ncbi:MAG: EAL domain-containing protein [Nocardioidaceae bacterium]
MTRTDPVPHPGPTRPVGAWGMLALGATLALSVSVARSATWTGVAMTVVSLAAIAAIVVGIRRHHPENRRFWWLCAFALGTSVVGGVLTSVLPVSTATVTVIDATYLAGYSMLVVAGLLAMPGRGPRRDWAGILDAVTIAIAGATLFWYYEVSPALAQRVTFHTVVTGVVWPVYDLLLMVVLIRMATSSATRHFPFVMVTVALVSSVVTDFWYAATGTDGGYVWGSVSDAFWVLPMTALGAAALHPDMRGFAADRQGDHLRITWARVFLVGIFAFSVPIVIASLALMHGDLARAMPPVLVGSTLLAIAGVARTAEMVRQSRNSAEASQAVSRQLSEALFEREQLHDELVRTALYDPLTGLANRRLFQERLDLALARPGHDCAVLFIDLDDFKNINDSLGHAIGDLALVELARRIQEHLRVDDIVARLGGDEFAVLVARPTDTGLLALGNRLLVAAAEPLWAGGRLLQLGISLGIARSGHGVDKDDLLRNADIAMYHAKGAGKCRLAVFEDSMRQTRLARLDLEAELRAAIDNDELDVVYQPIVDLRDGRVDGVEALVRWTRHDGTSAPTPDLIELAEETGLIRPLGRYVLRQATAQARLWREHGIHVNVAVNVSGQQLGDPGFVEAVSRALAALADEHVLVLEITESSLVGNAHDVEVLHDLRARGCRIAIDDFGTGFSSLAYLTQLPIDILKLAAPFVDGVDEGGVDTSVAQAVLSLGASLGYVVVAEGIERPSVSDALRSMGCQLGQGYLFAKPAAPDVLEPYLAHWNRRDLPTRLPVAR